MRRVGFGLLIAVGCLAVVGNATASDWRTDSGLALGSAADDGLSIRFTPRLTSIMSLDQAKLTLSLGPVAPDRSGLAPAPQQREARETAGFQVGGALDLDSVRLGAGYVHRDGRFTETEGFTAGVTYNRFSTGVGYAETLGPSGSTSRYALGAQLDAAPGLSLGADLTVRDGETDPVDTTGVVRLRLSF